MISAAAESELRTILSLCRGCEKSHGHKQEAFLFSVLADRLDDFIDKHGEAGWRRDVGEREQ